jgi:hypothetical protein
MIRATIRAAAVTFALAAVLVGSTQLAGVRAGTCPVPSCHGRKCPNIAAPVLCPDGCTYVNSCWASCAGESNCVRSD